MFVLNTIKFLNSDPKPYAKWGGTFWFLSMVIGIALALKELYIVQLKKEKLRKQMYISLIP